MSQKHSLAFLLGLLGILALCACRRGGGGGGEAEPPGAAGGGGGAGERAFALFVSSQPGTVEAGSPLGPVEITILDSSTQEIAAAAVSIAVSLGANPGSATLSGTLLVESSGGRARFADLWLDKAGTGYTLVFRSPAAGEASSQAFDVTPAPASFFDLSPEAGSVTAGAAVGFTVLPRDAFGNLGSDFQGTVEFASTDPQASLPDAYTFSSADGGTKSFPGGFVPRTAGLQTMEAFDAASGAIRGGFSVRVRHGALSSFDIVTPPVQPPATPFQGVAILTARDPFGNAVEDFSAAADPVTLTGLPGGTIVGLGTAGANVLDRESDFALGTADLSALGITFLGPNGSYRFRAVSQSGAVGESAPFVIEGAPLAVSLALFTDENLNGIADAGDRVVVSFDEPVRIGGATGSDFLLPVPGDSLGSGAFAVPGPGSSQLTIVLGADPSLKTRQDFDPSATLPNRPSGIDVQTPVTADSIESSNLGTDAQASLPVDLIPTLRDSGQAFGSGATTAVACGDFDGDGDSDLVEGSSQGPVRLWQNLGNGILADSGQTLGGGEVGALGCADVDADGDPDVLLGMVGAPSRLFLFDRTSSQFVDSGQSLGAGATGGLAVGDLDGDGDPDLALGSRGGGGTKIWFYERSHRRYVWLGQELPTGDLRALVLGDIDLDGDLDLVAGNGSGEEVQIFENDRRGSFTDFGQSLAASDGRALSLGDLDGDGDLDLVVGNGGGAASTVHFFDRASGRFEAPAQHLPGRNTQCLCLGDLDGDGDLDALLGNSGGTEDQLFLNDGTGRFSDSGWKGGTGWTSALALGDLDGDGDLDLVEGSSGATPSRVCLGSLTGTWGRSAFAAAAPSLGTATTRSLASGDLDADGDVDFVEGVQGGGGNRLWLNDGRGGFSESGQLLGSEDTRAVALADLDLDGDLDLAVGNHAQPNRVLFNDGGGQLTDSGQLLGWSYTRALALGDLDGDGDTDIVEGCGRDLFGHPNVVWTNDGCGVFSTDQALNFGNSRTTSIALGDLDRDGDLDVVEGNNVLDSVRIYWNDGTGRFTDSGQSLGSDSTCAVALGDLDRDGDLDIVAGNGDWLLQNQPDRVYLNDGAGNFADSGQSLGALSTGAVAAVDADGDGDLDLICGNGIFDGSGSQGQPTQLWWNDGTGVFSESGLVLGDGRTPALVVADLDRDGDLDVVQGNFGEPKQVFRNE